jgi:hypothetical protein
MICSKSNPFFEQIDTPKGAITVYLARFTLLDPPINYSKVVIANSKPLMELRRQSPTEMELLRRAYVKMMEG